MSQTHIDQKNLQTPLTFEILLDTVRKFEEQKSELDNVVGMTFSSQAWEELKLKFPKIRGHENFLVYGIDCWVLSKQTEDCVAWYRHDAMRTWIGANDSEFIEQLPKLPESISKG